MRRTFIAVAILTAANVAGGSAPALAQLPDPAPLASACEQGDRRACVALWEMSSQMCQQTGYSTQWCQLAEALQRHLASPMPNEPGMQPGVPGAQSATLQWLAGNWMVTRIMQTQSVNPYLQNIPSISQWQIQVTDPYLTITVTDGLGPTGRRSHTVQPQIQGNAIVFAVDDITYELPAQPQSADYVRGQYSGSTPGIPGLAPDITVAGIVDMRRAQ